jgi:hypothetical protein
MPVQEIEKIRLKDIGNVYVAVDREKGECLVGCHH